MYSLAKRSDLIRLYAEYHSAAVDIPHLYVISTPEYAADDLHHTESHSAGSANMILRFQRCSYPVNNFACARETHVAARANGREERKTNVCRTVSLRAYRPSGVENAGGLPYAK